MTDGHGYSAAWFDAFLSPDRSPSVDREIAFVRRHLPPDAFPRLLDIACGIGRHARALAEIGYHVLGTDISDEAIAIARDGAPDGARFAVHDMRRLDELEGDVDGVLCLWQSFGAFDAAANDRVLASMAGRLRPGGRLLLDLYNRDALGSLPATATDRRPLVPGAPESRIETRRELAGDRFRVTIDYEGRDVTDEFDWEVFTPEGIVERADPFGLRPLLRCAWFDPDIPPGPEHVRMQVLFERG